MIMDTSVQVLYPSFAGYRTLIFPKNSFASSTSTPHAYRATGKVCMRMTGGEPQVELVSCLKPLEGLGRQGQLLNG